MIFIMAPKVSLVEKHIVFYQVSDNGIEVARILHQRMDPTRHF